MPGTCTEIATGTDSITADKNACEGVSDLNTSAECDSIFTVALSLIHI